MKSEVSRRDFLKSSFAAIGFAALPGGFFVCRAKRLETRRKPNLVFGVLSDTHLRTMHGSSGRPGRNWPHKYFAAALEYFKKQNVDAVVHCGDFAHRGQVEEMRFHADVWRNVFGGEGPVKLFVTGNHDVLGAEYGDFVKGNYPDPEERAKHVLATDMAANWERIWGEKYESVWHKEVKGYHFIGQNYAAPDEDTIAYLKKCGAGFALDRGDRPFFFMRHVRPYANVRKKGLAPLRNAVAFFGHNHWSVTNWNMAGLYYGRLPLIECASCEPRGCATLAGDGYISKAKIEGREAENVGKGRQGYVVRVYDDMLTIERREFGEGGSLGADWVMPFEREEGKGKRKESKKPHPFSKGELKKVIGEPQFRKGAKLDVVNVASVEMSPMANIQSHLETGSIGIGNTGNIVIKIPLADGNPGSRVYAYEVVVIGEEGSGKLFKAVYAAGCNMGIGHEPNGGVTTLEIPTSELPSGEALAVAVRPLTSLGTSGRPIAATLYRTADVLSVDAVAEKRGELS